MAKTVIKRLLIIGNNPEELCAKYCLDTKVEPYVKYKFEDRAKLRESRLKVIEGILNSPTIKLTEVQREFYKNMYQDTIEMDNEEFFEEITTGLDIDEKTSDAYTTENPNGKYKYPVCYDSRLKETGEESNFSNPFKLKDGNKAYQAKNFEIDWSKNHMYNTKIYESAWELCVEGREPETDTEKLIKENMQNRHQYFLNFRDKGEYVRHSCCFWTDAVITSDGEYHELDYKTSDKKWIAEYYDKFINGLEDNILLTLYEVRSLND